MPLHLDYRPSDFKSVAGNLPTVKSIKTILSRENKDYPHAWLFQGPSGCGKTTLARIVAKKLGCNPISINMDFQEINMSNNRGIDTAREIQKTMNFMPMNNDCRVYLLDEVHQSTKDFQNALLKALEDTPSHVFFLLCTTDPSKLLKTIKNRCSVFEVKKLTEKQLIKLINDVLESEGEGGVGDDVIQEIANVSDGCPRQALVTLDQIIDLKSDEMLNAVNDFQQSQAQIKELCQALLYKKPWKQVAAILKGLNDDPEKARQAINYYMQAVILNQSSINDNFYQALLILSCFENPFFNNGKPGLTKAAADVYV